MPQIVTINESVIRGAQPNLLQQKGCLISLGATSLERGESQFVSSLAELQFLLAPVGDTQVQGFSSATGTPYILTESQKSSAQKPFNAPAIGQKNNSASTVAFSVTGVTMSNPQAVKKGDKSFIFKNSSYLRLPGNIILSSLTLNNLKMGDKTLENVTLSVTDLNENTLTVTVASSNEAGISTDIAPDTTFSLDISGFYQQDNTEAVSELTAMGKSWFANSSNGCWILELGNVKSRYMSSEFSNWFTENPQLYYSYVFPRGATKDANLPSFIANHSYNDARVYFYFCGESDDYSSLIINGEGQKSAFYGVEYSGANVRSGTTGANLANEHLAAAIAAQFCAARPSALNRLAPMNFRVLNGITPWPEAKNGQSFQKFKKDNVGFAGTANEGGVQGSILFWGNFMNGDAMSGWYGADWCSINMELQLANILIEGSQPGVNPLIYDQNGIARLTARAEQTLNSGVSAGCILAEYNLTATSFNDYLKSNPSDYTTGTYNGLAATITPIRGFSSLTFNLAVDLSGQSVTAATTSSTGA
ncbi:hypothetical protein [Aristophania vespae]|uniref:hypothetical protein n=1 Tax=Aristophania vespae TaxID=2697033 RepID=UPI00235112E8|nr:hypothetical protein [Aristophania vespae]UMM63161.1 hypothetical protein DM15PD_01160 [Aristophania vespae]